MIFKLNFSLLTASQGRTKVELIGLKIEIKIRNFQRTGNLIRTEIILHKNMEIGTEVEIEILKLK